MHHQSCHTGSCRLSSTTRASKLAAPDVDNLDLHKMYPHLKEILRVLTTKGCITRADLLYFMERPGGTQLRTSQPRLPRSQITELLNVLDPEHTGVIQLARLESLLPSITSDHKVSSEPLAAPAETPYIHEDKEDTAEEQKAADEKQTTQWADKVSVASASWRTVEGLLLDKLCEQLSSVLAALKLHDPQHTGYITQEDLKKVLSCYGMPISDTHFKKLCMSSSSSRLGRAGSSSTMVSYSDFLRNLGVPLTDVTSTSCCSHKNTAHTERPSTSSQSALQSIRQQSPCSQQTGLDTSDILDVVFQRMRLRLEQRQTSLSDNIQALIHTADEDEQTLSEADVQKMLEDSWVFLDDKHFSRFSGMLGFRDGRIERSVFQAKYEEAAAREQLQSSKENLLPTSAEQCLAAMRTRIQTIHGDHLTAFRLMDRKRKGVVDCRDFKALYDSLNFFCSKGEYQRLLGLIGLHPGNNLNYAEFVSVVENGGKQRIPTAGIQQQLHELLACEARSKWAAMSKALCQFDKHGQGWIYKKSLRGLLFTYALPIRPNEFEEFWLRYDPEGRGSVKVCDFLERLGLHQDEELRSESLKMNKSVVQQDADSPISSDATTLEHIKQVLQKNYKKLSDDLTQLGTKRDGTVTVEELLSLLHSYSCSVQREQLVDHLHRLKVSMDCNCRSFSYLDFLSTFDYEAEKCERPPASPDAESLDSLSPHMALVRMQELVSVSAHHLYKAFSAFDQSRTGTVRALDFRQVLQNFCARLSDKQYRYMLTKLQLDAENCTVNWKDFLNKFQLQSPLLLERAQRGSRQRGTSSRSSTQTKAAGVTDLLQQIHTLVSGHLYEISRELVDLDPSNSATVSKEHFRQLCDRHHLRLTNDQFECVWSQMPVNEQRKLQYQEFLKRFGALSRTPDTETSPDATETQRGCSNTHGVALHRTKSAPQCSSRRPASVGRPETGSPLGTVERRLRGAVQRCWKEIQRKCTELDPQREGHISTASFLGILQALNIKMTEDQFKHLAGKLDIMNNGHVSYHNFLRHFLLNLKPAETLRTFERRRLPLPTASMSLGILSTDGVEVMLRIYETVGSSWTSIRRCFLTSDRTRTGSVTVQDFRKVLRHFSVNLSEEEFFHVSSYFDANTTGKICYNSFLWMFLH